MSSKPSPRIAWAVDALNVQPEDHILEIGCGHGVAVSLLCKKLTSGRIVAIDRSAKMVEMARKRNAACIAAGQAFILEGSFPDLELGEQLFDMVFAIHVGFFWQRPERELAAIRRQQAPGGKLCLFFQPLDPGMIEAMIDQATGTFTTNGFAVARVVSETIEGRPMAGVFALPVEPGGT